jgi:predicted ABC-type sugar transport system permease subunit
MQWTQLCGPALKHVQPALVSWAGLVPSAGTLGAVLVLPVAAVLLAQENRLQLAVEALPLAYNHPLSISRSLP